MSPWSSQGVGNTLLAIVAVLLLVIVIQNTSRPFMPFLSQPMGSPNIPGHNHPPMGGTQDFQSGDTPSDFNPSAMVFSALSCPNDPTLTLADQGCQGSDAEKRKKTVEEAFSQNLPIPKVFDLMIQKFGEKALTTQALEIRRSRRRS